MLWKFHRIWLSVSSYLLICELHVTNGNGGTEIYIISKAKTIIKYWNVKSHCHKVKRIKHMFDVRCSEWIYECLCVSMCLSLCTKCMIASVSVCWHQSVWMQSCNRHISRYLYTSNDWCSKRYSVSISAYHLLTSNMVHTTKPMRGNT